MQEMAAPGKDHRKPSVVRRLDDLIVAYGAAGLYDGPYACFGQGLHAVGEGEESVACGGGPSGPFAGLLYGYLRRVDPAHLPRSYADRGRVLGEDYSVALDHAGDAPGKDQIPHLLRRRTRLGDNPVLRIIFDSVRCLKQDPARYVLGREGRASELACDEHPHVRFGRQDLPGFLGKAGGDQDLGEDLGDLGREIPIHLTTERYDAPERRLRVRGQRLAVGVRQSVSNGGAAGVGVLDDDDGLGSQVGKVREKGAGGVEIVEVVEGDLPPLQFFYTTQ